MLSDECSEFLDDVRALVEVFAERLAPFAHEVLRDGEGAMCGREAVALKALADDVVRRGPNDADAVAKLARLAWLTVGLHDTAPGSARNLEIRALVDVALDRPVSG